MKVVLHYRASDGFRATLEQARPPSVDLVVVDDADDAGFAGEMRDADALLHVLRPVTAADIAAAPRLRLIQKIGVGVNTIDIEAARARGVAVCNMPGSNSQAVAEMALMLILAALRRVGIFDPQTRAGEGWRPSPHELDLVGEIAGRTVGFLGFGAIPQRLAPAVAALGGEVIFTARSAKPVGASRSVSFDELLAISDVLSLHVPSTPDTRGIISGSAIARMKRGAVIVNTARGDLIDEAALVAALRSGHLRAAGLDVFAQEPAARSNPLFGLPNVVVMPHIAWLTPETLRRSAGIGFENCLRVAQGRDLLHRVA